MKENPEQNLPRELGPEEIHTQATELATRLLSAIDFFNNANASPLTRGGNEEGVRSYLTDGVSFLLQDISLNEVSTFIDRLVGNDEFISLVRQTPDMISNLYSVYRHQDILEDPAKLMMFSNNINLRTEELTCNIEEVTERIQHNPFAYEEELDAGVYREDIESQVRDALFAFRRKGYNTFESGFGDLVTGEQYIGFGKTNIETTRVIPKELTVELSRRNISLVIKKSDDRYSLCLTPTASLPSLEDWKEIWDIVAEQILPARTDVHSKNVHTKISLEFREKQEKMRRGESVYLGHGLQFEHGAVVPSKRSIGKIEG